MQDEELTQTLFAASLIAEALRDAGNLPAAERSGIEELHLLARGALPELRALAELRPSALEE